MNSIFAIKLFISFLVGGGYAIISTIAADKFGSKIGGLITSLPSTVLFGLLFIAWTQSPRVSVEATITIPATLGMACVFLVVYTYFLKRGLWWGLGLALISWAILAVVLIESHLTSFLFSCMLYGVLFIFSFLTIRKIVKRTTAKSQKIVYTPTIILLRGLIGGVVVGLSVFLAKIGGPVLGGMFATFPAMFISTLCITYFAHGEEFSSAIAKSSLMGTITIFIYTICARFTYIPFGVSAGTLFSLLICYSAAYFLYTYLMKRLL